MPFSILYKILATSFETGKKNFFARVVSRGVLNREEIIGRILKRGTTYSETDLRGSIELYEAEFMQAVAEGYHVNTSLLNARPSIKGFFNGILDVFDKNRHHIEASLSMGTGLAKCMANATIEKTNAQPLKPHLAYYLDHLSKAIDKTISSKSIGEINGEELLFDPNHAESGVFFTHEQSQTTYKVEVLSTLWPKKLVFLIPDLPPGTYSLEVRKSYGKEQQIRTGKLNSSLFCQST